MTARRRKAADDSRAHGHPGIRVVRIIARMNLGGPAHNVALLTAGLRDAGYDTLLVVGRVPAGEESAMDLATRRRARLQQVPHLGPELRPLRDLRALGALMRLLRRERPQILHTHTAKAGLLGRLAAILAVRPVPALVHTYHGHVLEGYFGTLQTAVFRAAERTLARRTDCLIAVSPQTRDDLIRLGVGTSVQFRVVRIGLDLDPFVAVGEDTRRTAREELGFPEQAVVALWTGRFVPVKRVDRLLRAFAAARSEVPELRLALVGDGPLRSELESLAAALGVDRHVLFLGYRPHLVGVVAASDIAVLSSDNEGTPVALIEAAAAARPAVATDVGGVSDVVTAETGLLSRREDEAALAANLARLARDPDERARMGEAGRRHVTVRFDAAQLLRGIDTVYADLLEGSVTQR